MNKYFLNGVMVVLAMFTGVGVNGKGVDKGREVTFPVGVTNEDVGETVVKKSETVFAKQGVDNDRQTRENLRKAADNYNDVLLYNQESKAKTVKSNLLFVRIAIVKITTRIKDSSESLTILEKAVLQRSQVINNMSIPKETRDLKLRELATFFKEREDYLKHNLQHYKARLEVLKRREVLLADEYKVLKIDQKRHLTLQEVNAQRTDNAKGVIEQLREKKIAEKFDKYQK